MSLFGAMTSGVSGLTAQSSAMGAIADNITNVNTVGYKNVKTDFQTLVTKQTAVTFYSAGGVQARPLAQNDVQGLLQATSSQTDLGISGQGFFVVNESNRPGLEDQFLFTRAGSFFKDDEGFLRNAAGFYLQGWPTDPEGNVILPPDSGASLTNQNIISTDFLQTVNLNRVGGTATETSRIAMGANLPAGDPVGAQHKVDVQFFDTLGVTKDISFQFTKSAPNAWELNVEPPSGTAVLTLHGDAGDGSDVYASIGQLEFTSQPGDGDTLTIAGVTYEFDDGGGVGGTNTQVLIGTKLVDTVSALVAAIQGNPDFVPGNLANHQVRAKAGNETVLLLQGGSGGALADFTVDFSGLGAAVRQAGSGVTTFTVQQKDVTDPAIRFDARGLPQDFAVKKMAVLDFVNGASDLNNVDLDSDGDVDVTQIALDFGTPHEGNGMTQFGADFTPAFIQQNGARFGTFAGVTVDRDGLMTALFDNGELRPIFKLPIATFVNPNGLEGRTGNAWNATAASGDPTLRVADRGPGGQINQAALEASTVDIGEEFTDMIMVQRAYSAATRIVSTADEMLEELVRMKR